MALQAGGDPNSFLPPDPDSESTEENDAEALAQYLAAHHG